MVSPAPTMPSTAMVHAALTTAVAPVKPVAAAPATASAVITPAVSPSFMKVLAQKLMAFFGPKLKTPAGKQFTTEAVAFSKTTAAINADMLKHIESLEKNPWFANF